jgi:hypothetical protein
MPALTWAQKVYFILVAVHLLAIVVSGALWTLVDLVPGTKLRQHLRDIQAVHFGSLYLVPTLLGLAWAFDRLRVPDVHQIVFPAGLGLLVGFSSLGYVFPRPPGVNPFYYWTKGPAMILALVGIVCLVAALIWTAVVVALYAFAP